MLPLPATTADVTCTYTDGHVEKKTMPLLREGTVERFRWKASEIPKGVKYVDVLPAFATAKTGEEGYFVMPNGFLGSFREQNGEMLGGGLVMIMPIFGMKTTSVAFVAIVTGMPYEFDLVARARQGRYTFFPRFTLKGRPAYDDIALEYHLLTGDRADYTGMAHTYRQYQLERKACVPLRERIKASPELDYARKSIEVRIRNGWKIAPSPVKEQTPATEPPMKVVVSFERVGQILDEFKRQGIARAEICLVGWNQKGHDGRFPQLFPVEESLGGEAGLRSLIKKAQAMGYQIVCHTNSTDAYRIANVWDEEYIIKNPDGSLAMANHFAYSGGQMYPVCPERAYERFAQNDFRAIAELGFRGLHYIDVLSIVRPRTCFDPRHPVNANQSAKWNDKTMAEGKAFFGGISSEGANDFCCGNLDYALYVTMSVLTKKPPLIDRVVPLWQLVYHGIIMSNPFTETVNYTAKDALTRLKLVEFGGRPIFYIHSKFLEGGDQWMGVEDLTCEDDKALAAGVARIKEGYEEYNKLSRLQTEFMERHECVAPDVFRTVYSDGSEIISNYRAETFSYQGQKVPPMGYVLCKK